MSSLKKDRSSTKSLTMKHHSSFLFSSLVAFSFSVCLCLLLCVFTLSLSVLFFVSLQEQPIIWIAPSPQEWTGRCANLPWCALAFLQCPSRESASEAARVHVRVWWLPSFLAKLQLSVRCFSGATAVNVVSRTSLGTLFEIQ